MVEQEFVDQLTHNRRVGRMLARMVVEKKITNEQANDVARLQEGPLWEEAKMYPPKPQPWTRGLIDWRTCGGYATLNKDEDIEFVGPVEHCAYCGSEWRPSRFHPGACDECGAPHAAR